MLYYIKILSKNVNVYIEKDISEDLSIQIDREPLFMKNDVLILHVSPWYYESIFLEKLPKLHCKVQPSY